MSDAYSRLEMQARLSKKLYDLKLGETCSLAFGDALRVPGGWVFVSNAGSVFIPYDNQFYECGVCEELQESVASE